MEKYCLEVCVDSLESAFAAWRGGASRLELCSNLIIGGTTPSPELFSMVQEQIPLPVHVLIRPRFGDFLYTGYECRQMCREIEKFSGAGAAAVVIGSLDANGYLNEKQMKDMIKAAAGCKITLSRAFDVCADPVKTLYSAGELGVHTILTSGQEQDCVKGHLLIKKLVEEAGDFMEILVGAGVNAGNIPFLIKSTGATAFHMSGKEVLKSRMKYKNTRVNMGLKEISEFEIYRTNENLIRQAVESFLTV